MRCYLTLSVASALCTTFRRLAWAPPDAGVTLLTTIGQRVTRQLRLGDLDCMRSPKRLFHK